MYRVELVLLIIVCQNGLDVVAENGYSPLYDLHRVVYTSVAHSPLEHALLHRLTLHLQVNNQLHWHHLYNVSMCNIRQVFNISLKSYYSLSVSYLSLEFLSLFQVYRITLDEKTLRCICFL